MWDCSRCTLKNEDSQDKCVACLGPKTIKLPDLSELERLDAEYLINNPTSPFVSGSDYPPPDFTFIEVSPNIQQPFKSLDNHSKTFKEDLPEEQDLHIVDDHFSMVQGIYTNYILYY